MLTFIHRYLAYDYDDYDDGYDDYVDRDYDDGPIDEGMRMLLTAN